MDVKGEKRIYSCVWAGVRPSKDEIAQILADHKVWLDNNASIPPKARTGFRPHDLDYAVLSEAPLENALLTNIHLQGAKLDKANLQGANLEFSRLKKANITEACLDRANLNGANLEGAVLYNVHLKNAQIRSAHLEKAKSRSAHFEKADFTFSHFEEADLSYSYLTRAILKKTCLDKADLSYARIGKADLSRATLKKANLTHANMEKISGYFANFEGANLNFTYLKEAFVDSSYFNEALLVGTNLEGAELFGVKFVGAKFNWPNFKNADLSSADLRDVQVLGGVHYNRNTKCKGIQIETCYGSQMFKSFVQDQDFLEELRDRSWRGKSLYWSWLILADCGRTPWYWMIWSIFFALLFALLFTPPEGYSFYPSWLAWCGEMARSAWTGVALAWNWLINLFPADMVGSLGELNGPIIFEHTSPSFSHQPVTFGSALYFSIVTFTTLGFGDVVAASPAARFLVGVEVVLGYVMLGGLISIFANKLARRS